MNPEKTIAIIGAGYLGTSIIDKLVKKGHAKIIATNRNSHKLEELQRRYTNIKTSENNQQAVEESEIIILATKQKDFEEVATQIKAARQGKLLISLGPTFSTEKLTELFGPRLVRLISPVNAREDILCYCTDSQCSEEDQKVIEYIFGKNTLCIDEKEMPIPTSYILFRGILNDLFEPLLKAGMDAGLKEEVARKILGSMLISTGQEIMNGVDPQDRLKAASGGMNPESFTMKLFEDLKPSKKEIERIFKSVIDGFK